MVLYAPFGLDFAACAGMQASRPCDAPKAFEDCLALLFQQAWRCAAPLLHPIKLMSWNIEALPAFNEGRDDTLYADDEEYRPRSLAKELTYFEKVKQRCGLGPTCLYSIVVISVIKDCLQWSCIIHRCLHRWHSPP